MGIRTISIALAMSVWLIPASAHAFCGFYVAGADKQLYNNATMVVMMRDGTRTVLSMQNNYQGPPEDFAMVVPVPVVLSEDNVKTLPRAIFDRVDRLAAPRLVEYWEQNPCPIRYQLEGAMDPTSSADMAKGSGTGAGYGAEPPPPVVVEAEFTVGEYQIVILSATEALALETWLHQNGYKLPTGAAAHLRPYVEQGAKFFVAKVDTSKVTFADGMAQLSPLRVHYDDETFSLPVRLGLINARDAQDLIVHILAPDRRYELANYKNVTIPTNLIVDDATRERFGEFYAALFDATLEKNPGSVVTEYAWSARSCDPCPDTPLTPSELATLGTDVLPSQGREIKTWVSEVTLKLQTLSGKLKRGEVDSRLQSRVRPLIERCHRRLLNRPGVEAKGKMKIVLEINPAGRAGNTRVMSPLDRQVNQCVEQMVKRVRFPSAARSTKVQVNVALGARPGPPRIRTPSFVLTRLHARYRKDSLGEDLVFREATPIRGGQGGGAPTSQTAESGGVNSFQGRYIIRHEWTGPMECENPRRGVWGGPPPEVRKRNQTAVAQNLAFAPRGSINLASMVRQPVAALSVTPTSTGTGASTGGTGDSAGKTPAEKSGSKGCQSTGGAGLGSLWLLAVVFAIRSRRSAERLTSPGA